jgi:hypothetical protein
MRNRIMHILFLSCLKATELIEKGLHVKLSITERLQLAIHKSMCDACRMYEKQSGIIDHSLDIHHHGIQSQADIDKLKSLILAKLEPEK